MKVLVDVGAHPKASEVVKVAVVVAAVGAHNLNVFDERDMAVGVLVGKVGSFDRPEVVSDSCVVVVVVDAMDGVCMVIGSDFDVGVLLILADLIVGLDDQRTL